jgi:hypothetical protein
MGIYYIVISFRQRRNPRDGVEERRSIEGMDFQLSRCFGFIHTSIFVIPFSHAGGRLEENE